MSKDIPLINDFKIRLRRIADYAFSSGYLGLTVDERREFPFSEKTENKFVEACHQGYGIAQKHLIEDLVFYQEKYTEKQRELLNFKKNKEIENLNQTKEIIEEISHRMNCLMHIADGIAWAMIGGQIHIARRFYLDVRSKSFLKESNLDHAIQTVDLINADPRQFALITDLTNFVQVGDILIKTNKGIAISELKQGKVNNEIQNYLFKQGNDEEFFKNLTKDKLKQMDRMVRQLERMSNAITIINEDEGIDPRLKVPIKIHTPTVYTKTYSHLFADLEEVMIREGYAVGSVEECVIINLLKDEYKIIGPRAIIETLKERTDNYLIINWIDILTSVSEPLFHKPISPDFITDMMVGKVHVWIGIEGDRLIEIFNDSGLKCWWMTVKETNRLKQQQNGMVRINGKGIWLQYEDDEKSALNGGVMSKIIFDNHLPSNIAETLYSIYKIENEQQ